jgi:hypothetical protein
MSSFGGAGIAVPPMISRFQKMTRLHLQYAKTSYDFKEELGKFQSVALGGDRSVAGENLTAGPGNPQEKKSRPALG